jgi:enoyl-CoA hydratase/carnithine racemase
MLILGAAAGRRDRVPYHAAMSPAPPTFETLLLQCDGAVARLTLNRPRRLNAMSPAMMRELLEVSRWLGEQPALRVVLLGGQGRAFCAGFDLDAMRALRAHPDREATDLGRRLIEAWLAIPAITLATVQGHCVGGGLLLAAACDLRLAADDTRFAIPEMQLGIPLAWGGVPLLVRLLGPTVAMQLVLDGDAFDAASALQWRFVNRCVPATSLDDAGRQWAERLAQRPLQSLRTTKRRFAAVVQALCTLEGSEADADDLLAAYGDSETRALQQHALAGRNG